MKILLYSILSALVISTAVGCSKNDNPKQRDSQRELFIQSVDLISRYQKRLINAKDTSTVDSLYSNFETELTELNMRFPAQTDFNMTESENDTLITLITHVNHLRDSLLKSLVSKPTISPTDTIE